MVKSECFSFHFFTQFHKVTIRSDSQSYCSVSPLDVFCNVFNKNYRINVANAL